MTASPTRAALAWEYSPAPEATDHIRLRDRYGLFIAGQWRETEAYEPTITLEEDRKQFEAWSRDVARSMDHFYSRRAGSAGMADLGRYCSELVERRQAVWLVFG